MHLLQNSSHTKFSKHEKFLLCKILDQIWEFNSKQELYKSIISAIPYNLLHFTRHQLQIKVLENDISKYHTHNYFEHYWQNLLLLLCYCYHCYCYYETERSKFFNICFNIKFTWSVDIWKDIPFLIIWEMQTKTTITFHPQLIRLANFKELSFGNGLETQAIYFITGENASW